MLLLNLALYSFMCIVQHPETDSELELEDGDAGLALQRSSSEPDTSEGESVSLKLKKPFYRRYFIIPLNNTRLIYSPIFIL